MVVLTDEEDLAVQAKLNFILGAKIYDTYFQGFRCAELSGGVVIAYASSEELKKEDGSALNAINGQASDHWHTAFAGGTGHPHQLIIDLGQQVEVAGVRYTPRQGTDTVTGRIKQYRMYVADKLVRE